MLTPQCLMRNNITIKAIIIVANIVAEDIHIYNIILYFIKYYFAFTCYDHHNTTCIGIIL